MYSREQMPQVQFQSVRVRKKIEITQLQLEQKTRRSKIAHTMPDKTFDERDTLNQAVVRTVNGTAGAWSIECHQYEIREIIFPASIKQAMEMQAEEHRKREECLQK